MASPLKKAEQERFQKLMQIEENRKCFDCGQANPQWVSLNNGVFICLYCTGIHRGFGVQFSFVRSSTMDVWNQRQLKFMEMGGNKRFQQFLEQYHLNHESANMKYRSKASEYYRELLRREVDGMPFTDPVLGYEEGRMPSENVDSSLNTGSTGISNNHFSSGSQHDEDEAHEEGGWKTFFGKFNCGFKNVFQKAGEAVGSVKDKISESSFGEKVKSAGAYVYEKGSSIAGAAISKGKEFSEDERLQNLASNTSKGFSSISEKMRNTWDYISPKKRHNEDQKMIQGYYEKMEGGETEKEPFVGKTRPANNSGAYIPPAGQSSESEKLAPENKI